MQRAVARVRDWLEGLRRQPPKERIPRLLTQRRGAGPDFLGVGAQKGGTGWLFDQVALHPDFWMPPIKELHYFNQSIHLNWIVPLHKRAKANLERVNENRKLSFLRPLTKVDIDVLEALIWLHGKPLDLDLYARLFNPKGNRISGDITPTYSIVDDEIAERVLARFPEVKVVFIARDPIERFWSNYCMVARQQHWPESSDWSAVEKFMGMTNAVKHSTVTEVARRWRRVTPSSQFGFYFFDDLLEDADGLRRRVLGFLGADPAKRTGDVPVAFNRKSLDPKIAMSTEARERLIVLFAAELRACAAEFGGAAAVWPKKYGV